MRLALRIQRAAWIAAILGLALLSTGGAGAQAAAPHPAGAVPWSWVLGAMGAALTVMAGLLGWLARQMLADLRRELLELDRRLTEQEKAAQVTTTRFEYIAQALARLEGRGAA